MIVLSRVLRVFAWFLIWCAPFIGNDAWCAPKPVPPSAKVLQPIGSAEPLRVKRGRDAEIHIACLEGDVDAQFVIKKAPGHGRLLGEPKKLNLTTASVVYRPPDDPNVRSDAFEFAVKNRAGVSFPATVRVEIVDPPVLLGLPREMSVNEPVWAGQPFHFEVPVTNDSAVDVRVRPEVRGPYRVDGLEPDGTVLVAGRGKSLLRVILNTGMSGTHRGQLMFVGRGEPPVTFQVLALAPVALRWRDEEWTGAAKERGITFPAEGFKLVNRAPYPVQVRLRSTPNLLHPKEVAIQAQDSVEFPLAHDANSDFREGVIEVEAEGSVFAVRWTFQRPAPVTAKVTEKPAMLNPAPAASAVAESVAEASAKPAAPVPSEKPAVKATTPVSVRPMVVNAGGAADAEADRIANAVKGLRAAESRRGLQRGFYETMEVFGAMPSHGIRVASAGSSHVVLEWENPQRREPSDFHLEIRRERIEDRTIPAGAEGNEKGTGSITVTGLLVEWVPVRPDYVRLVFGGSRIAARVDQLPPGIRHSFRVFVKNPGNQLDFAHAIEADTRIDRAWYAIGTLPLVILGLMAVSVLVWRRARR